MQKWILACAFLVITVKGVNAQQYEEHVRKYVEQFKELAMAEQKRSGIPASITLAQGIHETSAGYSELATLANNHFGIKCKKNWTGQTFTYTDDAPDECFRKYPSAEMSYKDHTDYLMKTPRYAPLFAYSPTDYASWAFGLKKCGYATNPRYAQVLIKLIEDYRLQEYTYAALDKHIMDNVADRQNEIVPEHDAPSVASAAPTISDVPKSSKIVTGEISDNAPADIPVTYPPYGQVVKVNGLKAVYARKGDMPLEYALKTDVRYEKLLDINDISDKPLQHDMYLYLERKHFKGLRPTHMVKEGETMLAISQYEGVQIKALRTFNQLEADEEPMPGVILQLQQQAPVKPQIIAQSKQEPTPVKTTNNIPEPPLEPVASPSVPDVVTASATISNENAIPASGLQQEISVEPVVASTETEKNEQTTTPPAEVVTDAPYNIANETPVEEQIAEEKAKEKALPQPQEPVDELDALKARFDKVVYSVKNDHTPQPVEAASETLKSTDAASAVKEKTQANNTGARFYVVKKGDTAFSIAKKHNISMHELMDWNKLDFETIKVGQRLRIKQ